MNDTFPSIFNDVIGPVMRGPSSSHVAAAARIGEIVRQAIGGDPKRVVVDFDINGSLAETHDGQGTDMGFICGILDVALTSEDVDRYWDIAREKGVDVEFKISDYGADHPNFYRVTAEYGDDKKFLTDAVSTGGGMIEVRSINGFDVNILGDFYETCLIADSDENALTKAECFCKENVPVFEKISCSQNGGKMLINIKSSDKLSDEALNALKDMFKADEIFTMSPILPTLSTADDYLPFHNVAELIEYNKDKNMTLAQLAALYESKRGNSSVESVYEKMGELADILYKAVDEGLKVKFYADRILGSQAYLLDEGRASGKLIPGDVMNTVIQYITAVMETKSSMGVIIAAPTAGSCGCLPGTVLGTAKALGKSKDDVVRALLAAGMVGVFFTKEATFAAEVGGCQMECGAGSGMAAAALTELMGGTAQQSLDAAAFALQGITGLACDPVANRVEVPCLNKNIMGGMNALSSVNVILAGFDKVIPLDEVIKAMYDIGTQLPISLRCTLGGLGVTKTSMSIRRKLEELNKDGEPSK